MCSHGRVHLSFLFSFPQRATTKLSITSHLQVHNLPTPSSKVNLLPNGVSREMQTVHEIADRDYSSIYEVGATPYTVGATLTLKSHNEPTEDLQVRILETYRPFTMSCVMKVAIQRSETEPEEAVLKLYDRRFAAQLRSDSDVEPWTAYHESNYVESIRSGDAAEIVRKIHTGEAPGNGWGTAQNEAYLHGDCALMFEAEIDVYERLKDYQGGRIPRLLDTVKLVTRQSMADEDLLNIQGNLLEYLPGTTFAELAQSGIPQASWQALVDQAIETVNIFGDHNILNEDVRPENILAVTNSAYDCGYRAVMVDFGQCKFRDEHESDLDWARAKHTEDEEGEIKDAMYSILQSESGFELEFTESE